MASKNYLSRIKNVILRTLKAHQDIEKIELDSCETNYDGVRFNFNEIDIMVVSVNGDGVNYITDFRSETAPEFLLSWNDLLEMDDSFLEVIYDNLIGTIRNEID